MSDPAPRRTFRWQALFHRATEAVFLLDRRRRLLFVNVAFEKLTGLSADRARGLSCRRTRPAGGETLLEDILATLLTPPPEVLRGTFSRVRRLFPGRLEGTALAWWDVEFLPLRQSEGYLIVGRVLPVPAPAAADPVLLPERLVALRRRVAGRFTLDLLDSRHTAMHRLTRQVRLAVETRGPVLLVGEPGVGKQTLAAIIHQQGRDAESAFAAVDCAKLPAEAVAALLVEPPVPARAGVGALYLREPGRLPRDLQQMLAQRLASDDTIRPRILAGTTVGVHDLVLGGQMSEELAALLSPLTLEVPPLRQRLEDLPLLVERGLSRIGVALQLTATAWEVLRQYRWPGNLTELFASLADSVPRATAGRLDAADLPAPLRLAQRLAQEADPAPRDLPLTDLLEQVEKRLIEVALRRARGNQAKAADLLGIYRSKLARRMEALGLGEKAE